MTLRRTLVLIAALTSLTALTSPAHASSTQESMFQDDRMLLNYGSGVQTAALNDLESLGVNSVHVDIGWGTLAPSTNSSKPPKGVDLTNPKSYKASRWAILDSLIRGAQSRNMTVLLTPSAPAPVWASNCSRKDKRAAKHKGICRTNATLYGKFVTALAKRYSGFYVDPRDPAPLPLPRVTRWSFWNEPNLKSWLWPATSRVRGQVVPTDAKLYRGLVYAATAALQKTGHKKDDMLLGESAPIGGGTSSIQPVFFYRALFCIDARGRRLKGSAAKALGCPKRLKRLPVTGIAHHPYTRATVGSLTAGQSPGNVSIGNISALRGVAKQGARVGAIPASAASRIYLTEFGVASRPPAAPRFGVSLGNQSRLINEAEYLAWRNGAVRSFTQFGLEDDHLGAGSKPGRLVFQTGLRFMATPRQLRAGVLGNAKPSRAAYKVPLFVVDRGRKVIVWGGVRGVKSGKVTITAGGRTVKSVTLRSGYFSTTLSKRKGSWQLKFGSRRSRKAVPERL